MKSTILGLGGEAEQKKEEQKKEEQKRSMKNCTHINNCNSCIGQMDNRMKELITAELSRREEEIVGVIIAMKKTRYLSSQRYSPDQNDGYASALSDLITKIKGE